MRSRFARAPVTAALLALIAIVMVIEWRVGAVFIEWGPHAFENDNYVLYRMGALTEEVLAAGEYWRLIAAMFLHANLAHWAANSFSLYQLGRLYEELFGSTRLALTYVITGVCASLVSVMHLPPASIAVGASGAVFGILGAFFFSILRAPHYRQDRWMHGLLVQLAFWATLHVVIGFHIPQIDNAGHIGGLVSGLVVGALLPHRAPPPPPPPPSAAIVDVSPT